MRNQRLLAATAWALAFSGSCIGLSPSYSEEDPCPIRCAEGGISPRNWTVYHSVDRLNYCNSSLLLSFSAFSPLDDPSIGYTLRACVADGAGDNNAAQPMHNNQAQNGSSLNSNPSVRARSVNETTTATNSLSAKQYAPATVFWKVEAPTLDAADISGFAQQLQSFLDTMDVSEEGTAPKLMFIHHPLSSVSIGIYAGTGVATSPLTSALSSFITSQGYSGGVLVQACDTFRINGTETLNATSHEEGGQSVAASVGIVAASGPQSLAEAQRAVRQWAMSGCVSEGYAKKSTLPVKLQTVAMSTDNEKQASLSRRGACSTTTVQSGDLCADLAKRCGISTADLLKYNNKPDFCTTLRVPQLVCCTGGALPVPEPDSNGNCKAHEVHADESCWSIANDSSFLFSVDDLEEFNKNTWGWGGCKNLQAGTIICLSPGSPPLPKPVPNAMCGPVKPGTTALPHGTDMTTLNPCPLNSCCDVWGFCGTTDEFCQPVPAGQSPGAPQPIGAPNCISNCGTDVVNNGSPPSSFISIGYFEGYGVSRRCQAIDIRNIDMSKYTHIHFAFATITPGSYQVDMGPTINQYYYFKRISGPRKILSFGGWTFSTDPATYGIFREGVLNAHRDKLAQNIADFIISEGLDGVDIDWEYPAAPDLPDIPTADAGEGENYYHFLKKLRSLLPSEKSVSFAAPASFWYLRGFPIARIIDVVDYVVYMTYDLHGQWDYGNKWTDSGCPAGNCLRSHVNVTETMNALSMITKAGVPSNKIAVGIASYGRSFQMTDGQCVGPMCTYTGKASGATPGRCTKTAGYISNAEIREILANNPTARKLSDGDGADILIYNGDQWVSYMGDDTKARRINMYRNMNFLGTSDWAVSLDNVGLVDDPDSSGNDSDDDDDDSGDTSDLGLGRFPGLVFKAKNRKLGKGAVQPKYHKSCAKYKASMQQSWRESGEIADSTMKYKPNSKFQRALDIYFGGESAGHGPFFLSKSFRDAVELEAEACLHNHFFRLWESHWGLKNYKNYKTDTESLGMNIHAQFFCGSGVYPEIWTNNKEFKDVCRKDNKGATTYQYDSHPFQSSNPQTVFCELATHSDKTWSLEEADNKAADWDYHLRVINMWKQSRPFIFYHESIHWKRVTKRPWCGSSLMDPDTGEATDETYDLKKLLALKFSMKIQNAENWSLAAMAMWIMDTWNVEAPVPVYLGSSTKRSDFPAVAEEEDAEHDAVRRSELEDDQEFYQQNHDPALVDPANFQPLFDEGELTHEFKYECSEGLLFTTLQCSLLCQGGLCTETYDGYVLCSSCNTTTPDEPLYKREEFSDAFDKANMSDWKIYSGKFQVSPAGLSAEAGTEGEAIVYGHKMADFIFEVDITVAASGAGASGDAGLVFRATHPDQASLGHTVGSYYAGISANGGRVFLNRMPDNEQLASAKMSINSGDKIHLKVQAVNETISVYVGDDMTTAKLVKKDLTFQDGFNGVQVHSVAATFSNVSMIPVVRQRGVLDSCSSFYRAVADETCQSIVAKHKSISLAQLHSWNPALRDDCSGLKTDYFYCVAQEGAFRLKTRYHSDCSGDVHDEVAVGRGQGLCVDTGCSVASLDIANAGNCPNGQVQISYWEHAGCTGKWFGYGYASRDTCRSLWSQGWKFGALHLRCADPVSDCVSQRSCTADPEPVRGICEAPPKDPPPAFSLKARSGSTCSGDVYKEISVAQGGGGTCLNTGCRVGSLDIAELGDCPNIYATTNSTRVR
ncbi:glycosyl hydrolases family 18 [Cordyceps javanica]|uniref:chitinase n=1 Tax=Cordyceps javanica TaxID=43265 RepID=A0A545UKU2_9HYPO|nr:glycosyl hydrolases family 18 [Cordyceps javanica]TQW01569.1 glycosyl hydrolases family 18 [Cordyceps javanica]